MHEKKPSFALLNLRFDGCTNRMYEIFSQTNTAISSNLSPYPNQTLKSNFSKTLRQKFKVNLYSDRARLTL